MANNTIWYGFLEAGTKSSPVVIDKQLNDDNSNALYIFNLNRNQILQYRRDIVEPKLRELNAEENALHKDLKSAFNKARKHFNGKTSATDIPEKPTVTTPPPEPVYDGIDDDDTDDDDFNLDDD